MKDQMNNIERRFALLDIGTGDVLFPYMKSQKSTNRYGFALTRPGEQDRHGKGLYTTDVAELIRRVVIDGWNVRVKTTDRLGKQREGTAGIGKTADLAYWVSPEFLAIVESARLQPHKYLPKIKDKSPSPSPGSEQSKGLLPNTESQLGSPMSPLQEAPLPFTSGEGEDTKMEADHIGELLKGFDGEDQDVLAKRRVNQGKFRKILMHYWEGRCSVSGVMDARVLVASHMIPWSKSTKAERGDPANGLLLSVTWDALFDRGMISFRNDGKAILHRLNRTLQIALRIDEANASIRPDLITAKHRDYLKRHRVLFNFE